MSQLSQLPIVHVVGAGLAGSEVAYQLAEAGFQVVLFEMKPHRKTPAQEADTFAELVCSNSFRSNNPENAVGLLKEELATLGSFIIRCAHECRVPAGDALAVDRERFSALVHRVLTTHPRIKVVSEEITQIPTHRPTVIATGPLTAPALSESLRQLFKHQGLAFYDAIAPILAADSLDMSTVFAQSRYDKGDGADYLNCPFDEAEYFQFVNALKAAQKVEFKDFEKEDIRYFEGCLPVEVMAERGDLTLAYGPMKPVGLVDPRTGQAPFAVVQLRKENLSGTAYNMVGFQTKLTYPEQKRVLRMIPGLAQAEFLRLGAVHRNTYIQAPKLLNLGFEVKEQTSLCLAGQIVGVEGYLESAAHGFWVAQALIARLQRQVALMPPPRQTALGALIGHVMGADAPEDHEYGPQNVNWGMFEPLAGRVPKRDKKRLLLERARAALQEWQCQMRGP